MTCACCNLPACCPAFRAFDGSNTFYRYLTWYDWDIPTLSLRPRYQLTPEDRDFAVIDFNLTPAPPGRLVDGHFTTDAAATCGGYPADTLPLAEGQVFRPVGSVGNAPNSFLEGNAERLRSRHGVNAFGGQPSPYIPSRRKTIFNIGQGLARVTPGGYEALERYVPADGDPESFTYAVAQVPFRQKDAISLMRYELWGEYPSPPSPYCHINSLNNPLP